MQVGVEVAAGRAARGVTRPFSTSIPSTSVLADTFIPASIARSRMIVPACSESTTPAPGV